MGLFDRPEVTILKEDSDARKYLEQLESLRTEVPEGTELAGKIDKEIAITKAGIAGEDAILFERTLTEHKRNNGTTIRSI